VELSDLRHAAIVTRWSRNRQGAVPVIWQGAPVTPDATVLETGSATEARLRELAARPPITIPDAAVPADFRRAAVLAIVGRVGSDETPALVLTERSPHLRAHAGEICLPGGHLEPGESPEDAALREAEEEIGLDRTELRLVGRLDDAWSKGRIHVVPVVGWYEGPLEELGAETDEVVRVIVEPLAPLARPEAHRFDVVEARGHRFENDVLDAGACVIYGFTADVVLDLLAFLTGTERGRVPGRLLDLERAMGPE
jgi:8-oxo-dGTP pyrophosphatase MutT (NUDIX family)